MNYNTVFIATEKPIDFMSIIIPLTLLLVGVGMLIYIVKGRRRVGLTGCSMLAFPTIFTSFAVIMTIVSITSVFNSRINAKAAFYESEYKVVEGSIENFDKMPYDGHKLESFMVNNIFFEYSDYESNAYIDGFNQTASHGGPITGNGIQVRITYVTVMEDRNIIIKLEVAND